MKNKIRMQISSYHSFSCLVVLKMIILTTRDSAFRTRSRSTKISTAESKCLIIDEQNNLLGNLKSRIQPTNSVTQEI
jgi:hypothetical protein